jgi:hypothetical protein
MYVISWTYIFITGTGGMVLKIRGQGKSVED